jgi:hypothetical protein
MPKAIARITTLTMLDAIAPQRHRFQVVTNPQPTSAKSATMQALERAAAELAAKGPVFPETGKEEPLPGVTHYGRVFDQPAYTAAYMARIVARVAARKGGDL